MSGTTYRTHPHPIDVAAENAKLRALIAAAADIITEYREMIYMSEVSPDGEEITDEETRAEIRTLDEWLAKAAACTREVAP